MKRNNIISRKRRAWLAVVGRGGGSEEQQSCPWVCGFVGRLARGKYFANFDRRRFRNGFCVCTAFRVALTSGVDEHKSRPDVHGFETKSISASRTDYVIWEMVRKRTAGCVHLKLQRTSYRGPPDGRSLSRKINSDRRR